MPESIKLPLQCLFYLHVLFYILGQKSCVKIICVVLINKMFCELLELLEKLKMLLTEECYE